MCSPHKNLTVAVRGLHIGRYGNIKSDAIRPMFIGYETLMHGYAWESFQPDECTESQLAAPDQDSTCPTFTRLFGHRMAVANLELRLPLIGTEEFGIIDFPFVPVELAFFGDAGMAWDNENAPSLELSRSSVARVPVFSTGAAARFNVLGFMVLEAYYAYPFQRPFKGGHWGFNISPGW
jgi:outer membrane protein assembly factor BamA